MDETERVTINNSDVLKHVIISLVNVSRTKTSSDYAWAIIKDLIKELKNDYSFLQFISITEINRLNDNIDDIEISNQINSVEPKDIGKAIQNFVDYYKTRMGKKAGYFFIQEFKDDLGLSFFTYLKEIGVDLRLIELKEDLHGMVSQEFKIKDDASTNIGFIERT
jgi:hypothetical protein